MLWPMGGPCLDELGSQPPREHPPPLEQAREVQGRPGGRYGGARGTKSAFPDLPAQLNAALANEPGPGLS